MYPNEDKFDDFMPEETQKAPEPLKAGEPAYIDTAIEKLKAKDSADLIEFKKDLDEEQLSMSDTPAEALTEMALEYIEGIGSADEVNICNYRSRRGVGIDAWGMSGDEDTTIIDLFITHYVDPSVSTTLPDKEADQKLNWLRRFFEQSKSGSIFPKIEDKEGELYQIADLINKTPNINCIRLYLISNAIISASYDRPYEYLDDNTCIEYHIWDARRFYQQETVLSGAKSIEVNLKEEFKTELPCLPIPDESPNVRCYLTYIPGLVLAAIYNKYHQQILEMNVRTFLQFKGASNKGIRNTLIGHVATLAEARKGIKDQEPEPDMFFSYNNGISTTASGVELNPKNNAIVKIKDWQIVNGGQTTASINAVTKMKDVDLEKLSSVYVAMKISVIKDLANVETLVPKISKFANTQTVVKKTDTIQGQFLTALEKTSKRTWVNDTAGLPVSKWFFERNRGQYLDMAKKNQTAKGKREFEHEYPKQQMIDKTLLFKFMESWEQNPAQVCNFGEKSFELFIKHINEKLGHIEEERMKDPDYVLPDKIYHEIMGKAILFKAVEAYYGKDGVNVPSSKPYFTAYTVAALSYVLGKEFDFETIWNEQYILPASIYNELSIPVYNIYARLVVKPEYPIAYKVPDPDSTNKNNKIYKEFSAENIDKLRGTKLFLLLTYVHQIASLIYKHLTEVDEGMSIRTWAFKQTCWEELKDKIRENPSSWALPEELKSAKPLHTPEQEAKIEEAHSLTKATLISLKEWGDDHPTKLTPKERNFIKGVLRYFKNEELLSYKQSKWILDLIEKAKSKGWVDGGEFE